jgi:uncharacterized lipoprotein YddW (UPF0748 family)
MMTTLRRRLAGCLALLLGPGLMIARADDPPEVRAPREFRAAWVATVANIDWPSKPGLSTAQQQDEARSILDRVAALNMNAVIFQVRTAADALYDSKIEPWSAVLTGTQGQPPSPYYDPLRFWVTEAHLRGLQLHAWINPFRARQGAARGELAATHVSRAHPDWVKPYGEMLWMDPGEAGARAQTLAVAADIVTRYDVDGLHIDDYFYPYPVNDPATKKEAPFPDDPSYKAYQSGGGKLARDDWRRENISNVVRGLYEATHKARPGALFGVSPFGIPRPGKPPGVVGFDQYASLYADTELWLREGWCDYWTPQLYWKIDAPGQPFRPLLNYWIAGNPQKRPMWPGLSVSRVGTGERSYRPEEIQGQIQILRETPGASGHVLFSMKALMTGHADVGERLRVETYPDAALIPETPWIGADSVPPAPKVELIDGAVTVKPADGATPFLWAVWGADRSFRTLAGGQTPVPRWGRDQDKPRAIAPVTRRGLLGPVVTLP